MLNINNKPPRKPGAGLTPPPGFLRRMGAVFYDWLLLLALLFAATALVLPLNSGQAFRSDQYLFPVYLLLISYFFYVGFWTHGGQTLGLRAWKIKVSDANGGPVSWKQGTLRFFSAILSWSCLGLGFLSSLKDKNRLCWHDKISNTCLQFSLVEKNSAPK